MLAPTGRAPSNGISDATYHLYLADSATYVGEPSDPGESERVAWVELPEVRDLVRNGQMSDGLSLTAVLYAMSFAL